jgi:cob(I)alamin adenosyltransferase
MMTVGRVDLILSTLNAAEVGTLESISEKLRQVQQELQDLEQPELAERAAASIQALVRGDIAEFKRLRAFLQSKVGHLRG